MYDLRPSAVAGSWYPADAVRLAAAVDAHLASTTVDVAPPCPRAIVVPHAGLVYSGPVAAYAYRLLQRCRYSAIVLVGPSHFVEFRGASIWPHGAWETPFGPIDVDVTLGAAIVSSSALLREHRAAHGREHSLEMQLPFVGRVLPGVRIVPIVMGHQTRETAYALGDTLAQALSARAAGVAQSGADAGAAGVLLVASSDLSHYEDARTAWRLDHLVLQHLEALDADGLMLALEREPRHACGGGPIVSVLRAASLLGATGARVLRYADSGDVSGDKSSVVGYAAAAIW